MCCDKTRDYRQTKALLWRIKTVLKRSFSTWCEIFLFPSVLCALIMITVFTYQAPNLQLNSTNSAYVTSTTPNATDNNFYNADSGFNTPISLRSCSLYNYTLIGLVRDSTEQGNAVLDSIYDEINAAFITASKEGRSLEKKNFTSRDEMEDYVKEKSYRDNSLCFALGWDTFEPDTNEFIVDISLNFGDTYETRLP